MNREHIVSSLERFFAEEEIVDDPSILYDDTDLVDAGIVDSLVLVMLVAFCDEEFDCQLEPDELTEDNFRSMETIAQLVESRMQSTRTDSAAG